MSRLNYYRDNRLEVITGEDHVLGKFFQIFDKDFIEESIEGEGLVLDWSEKFGYEINHTGIPNQTDPENIVKQYIKENKESNIDII